ncbi:hypothetical protein E3N88_02974 [Mikania micrantha]|uniref:Uncharacterized protein n=1 Tax=Mikania micrantha TaxID=192012 RepID=A0A5N6Q7J7_9ASTR|nr:hypothetical protein E3N88_02974 [Mikania micrantha]
MCCNKHVYLVLKYKETSSRLGKDGPENKKRRKLNSGFPRATRQPQQTLSRYARGGKEQNTLLNLSRYATDLEVSVALRHRLKTLSQKVENPKGEYVFERLEATRRTRKSYSKVIQRLGKHWIED